MLISKHYLKVAATFISQWTKKFKSLKVLLCAPLQRDKREQTQTLTSTGTLAQTHEQTHNQLAKLWLKEAHFWKAVFGNLLQMLQTLLLATYCGCVAPTSVCWNCTPTEVPSMIV